MVGKPSQKYLALEVEEEDGRSHDGWLGAKFKELNVRSRQEGRCANGTMARQLQIKGLSSYTDRLIGIVIERS